MRKINDNLEVLGKSTFQDVSALKMSVSDTLEANKIKVDDVSEIANAVADKLAVLPSVSGSFSIKEPGVYEVCYWEREKMPQYPFLLYFTSRDSSVRAEALVLVLGKHENGSGGTDDYFDVCVLNAWQYRGYSTPFSLALISSSEGYSIVANIPGNYQSISVSLLYFTEEHRTNLPTIPTSPIPASISNTRNTFVTMQEKSNISFAVDRVTLPPDISLGFQGGGEPVPFFGYTLFQGEIMADETKEVVIEIAELEMPMYFYYEVLYFFGNSNNPEQAGVVRVNIDGASFAGTPAGIPLLAELIGGELNGEQVIIDIGLRMIDATHIGFRPYVMNGAEKKNIGNIGIMAIKGKGVEMLI